MTLPFPGGASRSMGSTPAYTPPSEICFIFLKQLDGRTNLHAREYTHPRTVLGVLASVYTQRLATPIRTSYKWASWCYFLGSRFCQLNGFEIHPSSIYLQFPCVFCNITIMGMHNILL